MKIAILLSIVCLFNLSFSSKETSYYHYLDAGMEAYHSGDYEKSISQLTIAVSLIPDDFGQNPFLQETFAWVRYNLACSYALYNDDSKALLQLDTIATYFNFHNYSHMVKDKDLSKLHQYEQWKMIVNRVGQNDSVRLKNLDSAEIAILDSILQLDQMYRSQIVSMYENGGKIDTTLMNELKNKMNKQDALNLAWLEEYLAEKGGMPSYKTVGQSSQTIFFILQHSDLETQLKYLPVLTKAYFAGDLDPNDFSMFQDRISIANGENQLYGTQATRIDNKYYIQKLAIPEKVDSLRLSRGLISLEKYMSTFNIVGVLE